jgi:hypothetical protein
MVTTKRAVPVLFLAVALPCNTAGCDESVDCPGAETIGMWCGETSGLCWEDPPGTKKTNREDANLHCAELRAGGHDDWRVPDIDELRSLVRDCPAVEAGGACQVIDGSELDEWTAECQGCHTLGGPGQGGCFWDPALAGECARYYRSSSETQDQYDQSRCWIIWFAGPYLTNIGAGYELDLRCVRGTKES